MAALAAAVLTVLAVPGTAFAHAVLVASAPADGARVPASPPLVSLTFDERVGLVPGAALVLSSTGSRVDTGAARLSGDGRSVLLPLQPRLPQGAYTATWRVVSADSHVVTGSVRFGVGQDAVPAATVTSGAGARSSALDVAVEAGTGLVYAGLVLLIGVPAVVGSLWPSLERRPRSRRRIRTLVVLGCGAGLAGTLIDLLLRGPQVAGTGWAGVLRWSDLGATLGSPTGVVLVGRLVLLMVAALVLARSGSARSVFARWWVVLVVVGVGLLASVAVLGHAAADAAAVYLVPAAVLHLAAMSLWLGGLIAVGVVLVPALRASVRVETKLAARSAGRVLHTWSRLAFGCVAVLVVTGELQGLATVAPVQSLWATRYGGLLLIKLALVAAALLAAAGGHRLAFGRSPQPTVRALRRAVGVEAVLTASVLVVTAVLTMQPTARETYGPAVTSVAPLGADRISVHVDSTRRGPTTLELRIRDATGRPVAAQSVSGSLSTDGVAGLDVSFQRVSGTVWLSTDAQTPLPGRWVLTLQVSLDQASGYATETAWDVW